MRSRVTDELSTDTPDPHSAACRRRQRGGLAAIPEGLLGTDLRLLPSLWDFDRETAIRDSPAWSYGWKRPGSASAIERF